MLNLENVCTSNPTEFWNHLRGFMPKYKTQIPMEVYSENIEILCYLETVLAKCVIDLHIDQVLLGRGIPSAFSFCFIAKHMTSVQIIKSKADKGHPYSIHIIPKCNENDPRIHLNYRAIGQLNCIYFVS